MYKKINSLEKHHQFIASLIIGTGLISVWRGVWGLLDIYLFPHLPGVSFLASLILGIIILAVAHQKLS